MDRCGIVFSGSGGQGVITAAVLLAESAVLYEDLNSLQSQSYGPEARGGATRSDVIISSTDILFPKVVQPNVLVCLTQQAYAKFATILRPGGLLLTDSKFVKPAKNVDARVRNLPMFETVMEEIGKPIVFNICMLGAFIGLTNLVRSDSVLNALSDRLPERFMDMNRKALEIGLRLAEEGGPVKVI